MPTLPSFYPFGSRFSRSCFFFGYTYTGLLGHGFLLPSLILCVYMYSPGLRVHDSVSLYHTRRENARLFCGAWVFESTHPGASAFTLRIYLKFLLTCRPSYGIIRIVHAGMMELADVLDSKSSGSDTVRVRPPLPAPVIIKKPTLRVPIAWIVAVGVGFLVCRITVPRCDTGRGDRRYRADACGQRQRAPRRYATRTAAPGLLPGAGASR